MQITRNLEIKTRNDREDRSIYPEIPSANGPRWLNYVRHNLKFMKEGIEIYTKRKYAQVLFFFK